MLEVLEEGARGGGAASGGSCMSAGDELGVLMSFSGLFS